MFPAGLSIWLWKKPQARKKKKNRRTRFLGNGANPPLRSAHCVTSGMREGAACLQSTAETKGERAVMSTSTKGTDQ